MRARARRLVPLAVVVLMVVGCSDDDATGDAVLSASAPAPSTEPVSTAAAPATAPPPSPSSTQPAVDRAALEEALGEVQGLGDLEPPQVDCLATRVAGDDGLLEALHQGLTFDALGSDLQERVLLMAVRCAPVAVAESVVDGIEADLDEETRACIVDEMAGDDDFLVTLVQVVLATRQADPTTTAIPPGAIGDLETLMSTCDVPPTALPD
jgi:hypothetical protein